MEQEVFERAASALLSSVTWDKLNFGYVLFHPGWHVLVLSIRRGVGCCGACKRGEKMRQAGGSTGGDRLFLFPQHNNFSLLVSLSRGPIQKSLPVRISPSHGGAAVVVAMVCGLCVHLGAPERGCFFLFCPTRPVCPLRSWFPCNRSTVMFVASRKVLRCFFIIILHRSFCHL